MLKKLLPRKSASRWLGSETELELEKHFTVERKLGKGSYAVVYQVLRKADQARYALKVADVASLGPPEQADSVNEIRLLASLSHPHLVAFYEAFADAGKLCVVTELVRGGDLSALIKKRAASGLFFKEETVWAVFLQIALGVQYLHRNHVLHRDLKPSNLLLTEAGVLKLADLGISQLLDRVHADALIGTPRYMAPEIWLRQRYSFPADVWALGCILHELCTLRPLFGGGSDRDIGLRVLAGEVPHIPARYSAELAGLVAAMLRRCPNARPTVDDILDMPAARRHLDALPWSLRERAASPADDWERVQARLAAPLPVPTRGEQWEELNLAMPSPRYTRGGGVAKALGMKTKSWSTGDLQALARARASQQPDSAAAAGNAHATAAPAAQAAAAIRKTQSYGSLSAAEQAGQLLGSNRAEVQPGGGGPLHRRNRSSHALGSVAEEAAGETSNSPAGSPQAAARREALAARISPERQAEPALPEMLSAKQVLRALSRRSEGLSVQDAIVLLAEQQPQGEPAKQRGTKDQQQASTQAAEPQADSVPAPPVGGQHGVPLPSPAVTAQVLLAAADAAADGHGKVAPEERPAADARPASHPPHKRTHFWHIGKAYK